jgi:rhodanese-related sulfurtransferase
MKSHNLKSFLFFISILSAITNISCFEENLITESTPKQNDFLYIASFLETQREYITTPFFPSEVSSEEVFTNLDSYHIIDIREQANFEEGHIPNSVRISPANLIDYFTTKEVSIYPKIIIVSLTGQKSAYATTLLRLLGYNNVYSLSFGLGYWNSKYSDEWEISKTTSPNAIFYRGNFPSQKINSLSDFPNSTFDDSDLTLDEKIYSRVRLLFTESINNFEISLGEFEARFDMQYKSYSNCNIIFFGDADIFNYVYEYSVNISRSGIYNDAFVLFNSFTLRPEGATQFDNENISLSKYLLSLPTNKISYVYSVNGQESAAFTAFLNILGYNAKSIRFGAHSMFSGYFYNKSILGWRWIGVNSSKEQIDTIYTPTPIVSTSFNASLVNDYPLESGF